MAQCGIQKLQQRRQGFTADKQGELGRTAAPACTVRASALCQPGIVVGLARLLLGVGQGGTGLQAFDLGNNAGLQHALGRVIMRPNAFQGAAAQRRIPIGQLRREVTLHQQGLKLRTTAGRIATASSVMASSSPRTASPSPPIDRPDGGQAGRAYIALALQIVVARQAGQLRDRAAQLGRQKRDTVTERTPCGIQIHVDIGRIAIRHAGDGDRRPPSPSMPSRRRRALSTDLIDAANCSDRSRNAALACSKLIAL
jgi:hypothetical protein